jgi:hypothetical protein
MLKELFDFVASTCRCLSRSPLVYDAADVAAALEAPAAVLAATPAFYAGNVHAADTLTVVRLALFGNHKFAICFQRWWALGPLAEGTGAQPCLPPLDLRPEMLAGQAVRGCG